MFDFITPKVPQVEVKDLFDAIQKKEDFILLDVRTPGEYSKGKIAGSINLPVDEVKEKVESITPEKQKLVYVYCLSGSRSVVAVDAMIKLGYKKVFDVKSGLLAWRVSNFPVVI
jgi:rhodanese-related sulfurtransferase